MLTLADTGLRISEACRLTTGHFDWPERRAQVEIKGGRQSTVRFSDRAVKRHQAYLVLRDTVIVPTGMRRNARRFLRGTTMAPAQSCCPSIV